MSPPARSLKYVKLAGTRVAADVITLRGAQQPRLRFDRVAIGLIRRLQTTLSGSVPDGRTVVVTVTAPIWQDSKTGAELIERIRELLAARRTHLKATIHGNRVQVRVLRGGAGRTPRLIGFVHNPRPDPAVLFEVARALLACMSARQRRSGGQRSLVIANPGGDQLLETVRLVCLALRARSVFRRILPG